ncbi:MAG: helix-turn-helix transcriptional regulator [Candidatus Eisenbacteria bacterium]|nr:helix-turn-helix transcriptional regulator [Candidatus Eisenbacteria bacterium]
MDDQDEHQTRARRLLACLGVASRFRLMRSLTGCERCVTELAVEVGLSQSCTTRHLQSLQREGLVHGVRQGKRVVFRALLDDAHVGVLLAWVLASPGASAGPVAGSATHGDLEGRAPASRAPRPRRPKRAAARPHPHGPSPAGAGAPGAATEPAADDPSRAGGGAAREDARPPALLRRGDLEDYLL